MLLHPAAQEFPRHRAPDSQDRLPGRHRGGGRHLVLRGYRDHQGLPRLVRQDPGGGGRQGALPHHRGCAPGGPGTVRVQDQQRRDTDEAARGPGQRVPQAAGGPDLPGEGAGHLRVPDAGRGGGRGVAHRR